MSKQEIAVDGVVVTDPLKVRLKNPVTFEGVEISEIDLSPLEEWTCDGLIKASKKYNKLSSDNDFSPMDAILPEANLEYCLFIAAEATGLPFEFFKRLPAKEANGIKAKLIVFFNSEV